MTDAISQGARVSVLNRSSSWGNARVPGVCTFALVVGGLAYVGCERHSVTAQISASHIEGNDPADSEFAKVLYRDLGAFLSARGRHNAVFDVEFLRDGPTQTGMSYPKYYVWLRAAQGSDVSEQGAVRLAAIGTERFEVTDYLLDHELVANPDRMYAVFPTAVCERIKQKLGPSRERRTSHATSAAAVAVAPGRGDRYRSRDRTWDPGSSVASTRSKSDRGQWMR